jgi:hypothetical protein
VQSTTVAPLTAGLPVGVHTQPVPAKPVNWVLAGMASLTMAVDAAPVPVLLTVCVYTLTLPTANAGTGADLTTDNTGVVTVKHFCTLPKFKPTVLMPEARLVNGAAPPTGLFAAQLAASAGDAMTWFGLLVTLKVIVQVLPAAPPGNAPMPEALITVLPATLPAATPPGKQVLMYVASLSINPEGNASTKPKSFIAGALAGLVMVKTRSAVPSSGILVGTNAFDKIGVVVTTKHGLIGVPVVAPVGVTVTLLNAVLPLAAGHVGLLVLATLVMLVTVTVQLAVPLAMVMPVNPESVPPAEVVALTAVGPAQPVLYATVGAAEDQRKLVPSVSTMPMPDCAGLPKLFVKVKTTVVVAPLSIELAPNTLVMTGGTGSTRKHWLVMPLIKLVVVTSPGMLVNGAVAPLVGTPGIHTALLPAGVV